MKSILTYLSPVGFLFLIIACSNSDPDESNEEAPPINVPAFSSGLDSNLLLSSLSSEQIASACEELSSVVTTADAEIACRVVAAGESLDAAECNQLVSSCLLEPQAALAQTNLRSTPGAIDCTDFNQELVAGCDFPVSLLEACVNSLAESVVPAAESIPCSAAADFSSVEEAQDHANENRDTSFTEVCFDLLACEALVSVLLGGD
jgi:hypothetical protein